MRQSLQKLSFFLLLGVVRALSMIPLWVWYRISELGYVVLFYLIGYRKSVVEHNLRTSFPEVEEKEIQKLVRRFYLHFCDVIVETLKSFGLSDRQLQARVHLRNPEIADQMIQEDKGSILLASHYGNFEWMCARLDLMCQGRIPTYAVYNPFSSDIFESLVTWMRERRGLKMLPMRYAMVKAVRQLQEFCLFGFIVDQSPHRGNRLYFTSLLGKSTAFHTSVSKIALRTQAPVYYADVRKIARGRYELELLRLPTEDFLPESKASIHAFTDLQAQQLEKSIRRAPEYWLWSHKRWKYGPREGDSFSPALKEAKP